MVVKEDGSKWACQSCLKGHRVSGCTHTDRPLTYVPKKGRPVTQCQHCRVERKKRSAHVKCDCGEKAHSGHKCVHLKDAESKHGDFANGELEPLPEEHELEDSGCCCHHGGKCSCATIKKEHGDDSAGGSPTTSGLPSRTKPRLTSAQSDGHLTVFANGHHKPCHRNNNAAHEFGLPYKMPRAHTDHSTHNQARRSVDNLPISNTGSPVSLQRQYSTSAFPISTTQPVSSSALPSQGLSSSIPANFVMEQPQSNGANAFGFPLSSATSNVSQDYGLSMLPSDFTTRTDMAGQPATAWSVSASEADSTHYTDETWNQFDWGIFGGMDTNQPALTNTSSGSLSEVDELPPSAETNVSLDDHFIFGTAPDTSASNKQVTSLNTATDFNRMFGLDVNQSSRWSLPASFLGSDNYDGTTPASGSMTDARNSVFAPGEFANADFSSYGTGATLTASPPLGSAELSDVDPFSQVRPKAIYQKSNTMPSDIDWAKMLEQCEGQGSTSFVTNGMSQMNTTATSNVSPSADPTDFSGTMMNAYGMSGDYDLENDIAAYQPNDGNSMNQDYLSTFNFDTDLSFTGSTDETTS